MAACAEAPAEPPPAALASVAAVAAVVGDEDDEPGLPHAASSRPVARVPAAIRPVNRRRLMMRVLLVEVVERGWSAW